MNTRWMIAVFLLLFQFVVPCQKVHGYSLRTDSVLDVLDEEILHRQIYFQQKELRLHALKETLHASSSSAICFEQCRLLYEEYKCYQYDSAYVYARHMLSLARTTENVSHLFLAHCSLAECYTAVGFFHEASQQIDSIRIDNLTVEEKVGYYSLCFYLYQSMASFVKGTDDLYTHYTQLCSEYHRLITQMSAQSKVDYLRALWLDTQRIDMLPLEEKITARKKLLSDYELSLHEQAVQHFMIGELFDKLGRREQAVEYMAMAAILDIRSCTTETSAARYLATYMHEDGDMKRAIRYIHLAQVDANFYNTRLRQVDNNAVLPMIEDSRYHWISSQRTLSIVAAVLIALLLLVVVWMAHNLKKRNLKLMEARLEIESKALLLRESNEALSQANSNLKEANDIKDQYIIQSLYGDSGFVNRVEEQCRWFERHLKAKQYAELTRFTASLQIKQERERMSMAFDQAFLKLFPHFLEAYNELFEPEHRLHLDPGSPLPTEVRIFALMRLGIEETAVVGKYLNLSPNSIYVYKAKAKARSKVCKEEFDQRIKAIQKA